jgi:hypothetical protein
MKIFEAILILITASACTSLPAGMGESYRGPLLGTQPMSRPMNMYYPRSQRANHPCIYLDHHMQAGRAVTVECVTETGY